MFIYINMGTLNFPRNVSMIRNIMKFTESTNGSALSHLMVEASDNFSGGENGDIISIDAINNKLDLKISNEEMEISAS